VSGPLVVVGDVLLDRDLDGTVDRLSPDAPVPVVDEPVEHARPGGAGLAALLAAADGREVVLVTALSQDAGGQELRGLLDRAGVRVVDLGLDGATPEKVRVRSAGRSLLRLDRGGPAGVPGDLTDEAAEVLAGAGAVLVADYGRGVARGPRLRAALAELTGAPLAAAPGGASAAPLPASPGGSSAAPLPASPGGSSAAAPGDPGRSGAALAAATLPGSPVGAAAALPGSPDLAASPAAPLPVSPGDPGRSGAALATAALPGSPGGAAATLPGSPDGAAAGLPGSPAPRTGTARRVPVVWDPHPRGPEPVPGSTLVTPNGKEAEHFAPGHTGGQLTATTARARALQARWGATAVSVTLGSRGALVVEGETPPSVVPAPDVPCPDPCGAGDRFASAAAGLLADGALPSEAVAGAVVAASAFVAAGGASSVRVGSPAPAAGTADASAAEVVARVHAAGGIVVATGGCFDLLHAGHVAVLQQARALGDCLVVLLNSDDSVRRLKGPSRPLQSETDRADVLRALGCVDAVHVFGEDTPSEALTALRPDVFAKGGDYALTSIPEADVVAGWGGQAVVLPYLAGRSTTNLIREAGTRAQH